MKNIELLPCPLCNGTAHFIKMGVGIRGTMGHDEWNAVECKQCGLRLGSDGRRFREKDDLEKEWNRRQKGTFVPDIISDKERGYVREEIEIVTKAYFENELKSIIDGKHAGVSWVAMSCAVQAYIDAFKGKL